MISKEDILNNVIKQVSYKKSINNIFEKESNSYRSFSVTNDLALLTNNMVYYKEPYKKSKIIICKNELVTENVYTELSNIFSAVGNNKGLGEIINIEISDTIEFHNVNVKDVNDLSNNPEYEVSLEYDIEQEGGIEI